MSQALYRKWRPQKWDEIIGQSHIVQTLKNAVSRDRVAHAYLFSGPRGTGKTTAARLLAKAVNCLDADPVNRPCNTCEACKAVNENRYLDLIEIDAASQTGVDDVRDLRDKINFTPNQGRYKLYIIDEVHMFSNSAFNALLKTLEEPPPHAIFILATTEIYKIPATVLSRCQRHDFRRIPMKDIVEQLRKILQRENIQAEPEALELIARQSTGGMRDAISLLDQLASSGGKITLELAHSVLGTATSQTVLELIEAVKNRDAAAGLKTLHNALDAGADPRLLARQVVDYLRVMLLVKMGNSSQVNLTIEIKEQVESHAEGYQARQILSMVKIFNNAATEQRGGWQPALPLELALSEVIEQGMRQPLTGWQTPMPDPQEESTPKDQSNAKGEGFVKTPIQEDAKAGQEGEITLGQVIKAWKQVGAVIRDNPNLKALLNSCRVLELRDKTLTLGFASEILRDKAETAEQVTTIRKAILEVLGVDLAVRCTVSNAKQSNRADVKADGMVAAAIKAGGEIIDIQ